MELRGNSTLETPCGDIPNPNECPKKPPSLLTGEANQRPRRNRNQQILNNQQGQSRGEEAIDQPQKNQNGVEVITQKVVTRPLNGHDRRREVGIGLRCLGENSQIPRRDGQRTPLAHREGDVQAGAQDNGKCSGKIGRKRAGCTQTGTFFRH